LGTFPDGTIRVSTGPFNTEEDIDHLARALAEVSA
jgi:selenocysteine lyase/cysteine desulfurase